MIIPYNFTPSPCPQKNKLFGSWQGVSEKIFKQWLLDGIEAKNIFATLRDRCCILPDSKF
jgi:hypothetical protein